MTSTPPPVKRVIRDAGIVSLIALALGAASTIYFLRQLDTAVFAPFRHRQALWWLGVTLLASAANLAVRFIRWQYLLRRCGVLVPARASARIFYSAFALLLTPLYLGEISYKAFFMRRRHGAPIGVISGVALAERLYDALALTALGGACGLWTGHASALLLAVFALVLLRPVRRAVAALASWPIMAAGRVLLRQDTRPAAPALQTVAHGRVGATALLLSVAAWIPPAVAVSLIAAAARVQVPAATAARLFSASALLGGVSFSPGGVVIAGQTILEGLRELGTPYAPAVAIVLVLRIATLGLALAVGVSAMLWAAWSGEFAQVSTQAHFDRLSETYDVEIPAHVRAYLVRKKVGLMRAGMEPPPALGLDVGCGRGYYVEELARRGYRIVGVDLSAAQLRCETLSGRAAAADVRWLPFAAQTFTFVYSVNLFHHLPSAAAQQAALEEVGRVLKPGGKFFLHEINVSNPVFRFYMGYVFPLLRNIDRGTERWVTPAALACLPGMRLDAVRYFTFIPDFLPRWAMPYAQVVETRIEAGPWARLGAHFLAVFTRA